MNAVDCAGMAASDRIPANVPSVLRNTRPWFLTCTSPDLWFIGHAEPPPMAAWPAVNAPVPIPQPVRGHFASCYVRPAFTMAGQFCRCQGAPAVPVQLMGGFP